MKRRFAIQAAVVLVLVWTVVWGVSRWADASIPSAEKLLHYVESRPWETQPRAEVLDRVITEYSALSFLDKRVMRDSATGNAFLDYLRALSSEEKATFVHGTMPAGFQELVDGFTRMPEKDRMRVLERSHRELMENLSDSPVGALFAAAGPALLQKIANEGIGSFFEALPPESKLQIQPMIEQMLNNAHRLRD